MKHLWTSLAGIAVLAATSAQATTIRLDGSEMNLQQIVNGITVGGSSSVDVVNDQYAPDEGWRMDSPWGGYGMIVLELAGYAGSNRFGLYDIESPGSRVQLFGGSDSSGAGTQFAISSSGEVFRNSVNTGLTFTSELFGFYLETPDGVWYSQASLNADRADHMVAYQGEGDRVHTPFSGTWDSNLFLLGWEDLTSRRWDQDYNDFVVFVHGVKGVAVPEPATLGLLGFGLAGMGLFGRRRKKA